MIANTALKRSIRDLGKLMIDQFTPAIPGNVSAWHTTYENGSLQVAISWSATGWTFTLRSREQKGPVTEDQPLLSFSMRDRNEMPCMINPHVRPDLIIAAIRDLTDYLQRRDGQLLYGSAPFLENDNREASLPFTKSFIAGWFAAFFSIYERTHTNLFTTVWVHITTEERPHDQLDLLLDFQRHEGKIIKVYQEVRENGDSRNDLIGTIHFDSGYGNSFTKREDCTLSDHDVSQLLCAFISSFTESKPNKELL